MKPLSFTLCAVALAGLAVLAASPAWAQDTGEIKIGLDIPLSGSLAP